MNNTQTRSSDSRKKISGSTIKIIAIITMLIGIAASAILDRMLMKNGLADVANNTEAYQAFMESNGTLFIADFVMQLIGGVIIAIGLVLPGISVSQMLYMLGIYESIMADISSLNVLPLIPLGIGVLGGTFLTAKVLESLMERHPQPTYLIILGFMFGSLPELFPGIPGGADLIFSAAAAVLGFLALYWMSGRESAA